MVDFVTSVVFQGIFIGVVIAVLTVGYNKLIIGKFVKALINAEANHPAFAKSFSELNVKKNIFIALALRGAMLKKIVAQLDDGRSDNDKSDKNGKNNREHEIKYYIPEDKLYRAGRLYGGKDVDILMIAAMLLLLFLFFGLLLLYFPVVWGFVADIFESAFGGQ